MNVLVPAERPLVYFPALQPIQTRCSLPLARIHDVKRNEIMATVPKTDTFVKSSGMGMPDAVHPFDSAEKGVGAVSSFADEIELLLFDL